MKCVNREALPDGGVIPRLIVPVVACWQETQICADWESFVAFGRCEEVGERVHVGFSPVL